MNELFQRVWRVDSSQPGFAVLDMGVIDSRALRAKMVEIKQVFSQWVPFGYSWLMRFDQQSTSKFHKDGGPPENLLILGYEPSRVKAKISIGDWKDYGFGKEMPADKISTITEFPEGHSVIVLINNSHEWGVWHRAEILNPDPTQPRIINSMQLVTGIPEGETLDQSHEQEWLTSEGFYHATLQNDVRPS